MSKYTLPNGIQSEGKLYNLVELDEIRGRHQDMLADPTVKTPIDHIEPLLKDLMLDITNSESESLLEKENKKQLILRKLPIQDIQFLMAKVREVTYGPDYLLKLKCTHCEADNNAKLDLSSLEVFPRKDKISEKDMVLPKEGISFSYGYMNLSHLLKMAVEEGTEGFTKSMLTSLTSYMLSSLGDKKEVKSSDLGDLRGSDLDYIRDNMPELAELDLKVQHICTNKDCGKEFEQELPVLAADFLLPSRT